MKKPSEELCLQWLTPNLPSPWGRCSPCFSKVNRPGPQTHLRPRSQQRPHDQGQRLAEPLAPAEAAASGPTISRVRSVRGVAPGNHISSSFDCSTLLIFILASTRYEPLRSETSAPGDKTRCKRHPLPPVLCPPRPRKMVSPCVSPPPRGRPQFQNGGGHCGASPG